MTSKEQQAKDLETIHRVAGGSCRDTKVPHDFESYCGTRTCRHCKFADSHDIHSPVHASNTTVPASPSPLGPVPAAPLPTVDEWKAMLGDPGVRQVMEEHLATEALWPEGNAFANSLKPESAGYDAVSPPHYQRGPVVKGDIGSRVTMGRGDWEYAIQCIDVMRAIQDPRLATALKYIWRVAFGGKSEPWDSRTSDQVDTRDISSAIWYLQDYLEHPPVATADGLDASYNASQED